MRARTFQWIIMSLILVPSGGCGSTPQEQLAAIDTAVTYLQDQSAKIDARLADVDAFMVKTEAALRDPNIAGSITAEILSALERARAEKPQLLEAKAKADRVLADLRAGVVSLQAGGQVDTASLLRLGAQTLDSAGTEIGGEAGGWMKLAGGLLLALFGTGGVGAAVLKQVSLGATRRQLSDARTEAGETSTALGEVVEGGERWKAAVKAGLPEGAEALSLWKQAMKDAQVSEVTKQQVALARAMIEARPHVRGF